MNRYTAVIIKEKPSLLCQALVKLFHLSTITFSKMPYLVCLFFVKKLADPQWISPCPSQYCQAVVRLSWCAAASYGSWWHGLMNKSSKQAWQNVIIYF